MNPTARQCLREGFTGASELRAQSILSDLISAFGKAKASLVQGQIEHHLEDIVSRLSRDRTTNSGAYPDSRDTCVRPTLKFVLRKRTSC